MLLKKYLDLPAGTTDETAEYTPAVGELVFLEQMSTQGPANSFAKGSLVFGGDTLDGWSGDKVISYPEGEAGFTLVGDGVKKLVLRLENSASATAYRVGATLVFASSLE